jgi:hypothetical protein
MAKVLCVLYDDPVDGYPKSYARDDIPQITSYPGGQTAPTPHAVDFTPGQLLGSVSGELGLRRFLEDAGHTLVVTSDKEGPDSVFDRELPDADVVISQPFWPAYLTKERIARAKNLKLAITAGIGSDHVDLQAASEAGMTVAEVTYSNSISVSEHVVMMILGLVRNYIPSYGWLVRGGWNIADCVERSYDLEGMTVGSVAAGRIGTAVLKRLAPFDVRLAYTDPHRLPEDTERELGLTFYETPAQMVPHCDVVTINAPLYPGTLCRRHPRDPRMLAGGPPHPRRVPHHLRRRPGRHRSPLLQALTAPPGLLRVRWCSGREELAQAQAAQRPVLLEHLPVEVIPAKELLVEAAEPARGVDLVDLQDHLIRNKGIPPGRAAPVTSPPRGRRW